MYRNKEYDHKTNIFFLILAANYIQKYCILFFSISSTCYKFVFDYVMACNY